MLATSRDFPRAPQKRWSSVCAKDIMIPQVFSIASLHLLLPSSPQVKIWSFHSPKPSQQPRSSKPNSHPPITPQQKTKTMHFLPHILISISLIASTTSTATSPPHLTTSTYQIIPHKPSTTLTITTPNPQPPNPNPKLLHTAHLRSDILPWNYFIPETPYTSIQHFTPDTTDDSSLLQFSFPRILTPGFHELIIRSTPNPDTSSPNIATHSETYHFITLSTTDKGNKQMHHIFFFYWTKNK